MPSASRRSRIGPLLAMKQSTCPYFHRENEFCASLNSTRREAMSSGRGVQLAGFLVPGEQGSYDANSNFTFSMQDSTGKIVQVIYPKPKPANFEQAISIVAIGHYDASKNAFLADDMLVKCPSKYQEQLDQAKG